jgi:DNA-binding PadR family transcriptional regulator
MDDGQKQKEFRTAGIVIAYMAMNLGIVAFMTKILGVEDAATTIAVLVAPLILYGVISGRLNQLTAPGGWGAKFSELEREVETLKPLRFLITAFLTEHEWRHLARWDNPGDDGHYTKVGLFTEELRRLRALGFIKPKTTTAISAMPQEGFLKEYFEITERGKEYLRMRREWSDETRTHRQDA